jgi:hypothetical protein
LEVHFQCFESALQRKSHLCVPFLGITQPHIHVSVSNLYIPRIGPHIWLKQNKQSNLGNIEISHRYMSVLKELGDRILFFCFGNKVAAQFHFWEYINGNHTFILDSHRPFICSADSLISNPDPDPLT